MRIGLEHQPDLDVALALYKLRKERKIPRLRIDNNKIQIEWGEGWRPVNWLQARLIARGKPLGEVFAAGPRAAVRMHAHVEFEKTLAPRPWNKFRMSETREERSQA